MSKFQSTKSFYDFPCSHRRWRHDGHCKWIHGYSRSFHFWFECEAPDENLFVVDFGALDDVKDFLNEAFDHTMLIDKDDPEMKLFQQMHLSGICKLIVMPYGAGMEGTAKWVYEVVNQMVRDKTSNRAWICKVEVRENKKNSAIYIPDKGEL